MREIIWHQLAGLTKIYEQELTDELVDIWTTIFEGISEQEFIQGIVKYCLDPESKFFPKPGQIYSLIRPESDSNSQAALIADSIFTALRNYGADSIGKAKARSKIGEIGWQWVERIGGWQIFIESVVNEEQVPTLKAQCRMALKGLISKQKCNNNTMQIQNCASPEKQFNLIDLGVYLKNIDKVGENPCV
jgi:hypothetical protein